MKETTLFANLCRYTSLLAIVENRVCVSVPLSEKDQPPIDTNTLRSLLVDFSVHTSAVFMKSEAGGAESIVLSLKLSRSMEAKAKLT